MMMCCRHNCCINITIRFRQGNQWGRHAAPPQSLDHLTVACWYDKACRGGVDKSRAFRDLFQLEEGGLLRVFGVPAGVSFGVLAETVGPERAYSFKNRLVRNHSRLMLVFPLILLKKRVGDCLVPPSTDFERIQEILLALPT